MGQLANGQTDPSLPGQDFFANANLRIAAAFQATDISLQTALDDATSPITWAHLKTSLIALRSGLVGMIPEILPLMTTKLSWQDEGAQSPALKQGDEASFQLLVPVQV